MASLQDAEPGTRVPDAEPTLGRGRLATAGLLTGVAGIATSTATAWLLRAQAGPVASVGSAVRDLTPGSLATWLVHAVKHADKPLLVGGTVVVLLALCVAAGLVARRHPVLSDVIFVVLAALGFLAAVYENELGIGYALAVVVGLVTWVVVLRILTGPELLAFASPAPLREVWPERRSFLLRAGAVVIGSAAVTGIGWFSGRGLRQAEQARELLRLPVSAGTVPAGADLGVRGVAPWRTAARPFYIVHTALTPPAISPADWRLRIHGMVDREVHLDYDDLVRRRLTQAWITLCCVSNPVGGDLIGNAWWSGVPVRDLLAEAGVRAGADAVKQTSKDGWTCGTPLAALTDARNAMLAVAMNGEPLPIEHGFPVRCIVPGLYGYVSGTKWLVDMEVTRFDRFTAYWTERGWSQRGPVKTESRIDSPRNGDAVRAGTVRVGGSAWDQHTGISRVEYQLDGGPWHSAELGRVPNADTWVQWSGPVQVGAGRHRLAVRATNADGVTQTAVRADVVPNGATGWHTVSFTAS